MSSTFTVYADQGLGDFAPLHGVNNGPLVFGGFYNLIEDFRLIKPASIRLHDSALHDPGAVDVPLIFPDFSADPDDPASYDFQRTDVHMAETAKVGAEIVYRLGTSIEHSYNKYFIDPPSDPAKWAQVCAHIIRHYNQRWAEGFEYGIRHWEIWNEPDVPNCWTGTTEQYLELYRQAALAVKEVDSSLLVGGPAAARASGEPGLIREFLAFCRDTETPVDFVSWHGYASTPAAQMEKVAAGLEAMKDYGYAEAESHYNEWNLWPSFAKRETPEDRAKTKAAYLAETQGASGAAFVATMLALFQDSGLSSASYYSAMGGGLSRFSFFDRYATPTKPYFVFRAFRELTDCGQRVRTEGNHVVSGRGIVAARDPESGKVAVLLSNFDDTDSRFDLTLRGLGDQPRMSCEQYVVDGNRDFEGDAVETVECADPRIDVSLPAPSVRLLLLTKDPSR